VWYTGSGAPDDGTGVDGDLYLDTDTGDVYQKAGGTWGDPIDNITGPEGPEGPIGPTAQLVISQWDDYLTPLCRTTVYVNINHELTGYEVLIISGSDFPPLEEVTITICEQNFVWYVGGLSGLSDPDPIITNECGAFSVQNGLANIFAWQFEYLYLNYICYDEPVSVSAWVNATWGYVDGDPLHGPQVVDGDMLASWPLLIDEEPSPP
jgi:hypothetical protein